MIPEHLKVGQNWHKQPWVVFVVGDQLDQGLEGFFLLLDISSLELLGKFAGLRRLDHRVVVDDKVAVSAGFVNRHLGYK